MVKVNELSDKINKQDLFIFYFAGHGATINNQLYLYPSDFDIRVPLESSLNLNSIIKKISSQVRKKLIICDCCRAMKPSPNGYTQAVKEFQSPLFFIDEDTYIINACSNGQFSYEMFGIENANSCRGVFSYFFENAVNKLSCLNDSEVSNVTLFNIFEMVRENTAVWVANSLSKQQVPIMHGGNSSDWYFFS